jgi:hypothetical protein
VLFSVAAAAHGAESGTTFDLRAEGSFPVQHRQASTATSRQTTITGAPYLGLSAIANVAPDLSLSVFANGGHNELGSFRDNNNTFVNFGGNVVKRWGAFSAGVSIEHTHFYEGSFGDTANIANEANVFVRYAWRPNPNLRITPGAILTARADEHLALERYTASARIEIEQRLSGAWWLVASPRFRHLHYVGSEAGRRDDRLGLVSGLKYQFNDSVAAMMLAGYEHRFSNVAAGRSERFLIGASLDFNFSLLRPR